MTNIRKTHESNPQDRFAIFASPDTFMGKPLPLNTMSSAAFIHAILETKPFPHAISECRLVETHISWVFLTGDYAYKIKKPVNFGFLDFSTLEKRRYYCQQEIRLNRRLAKDIYLDVVAIGEDEDGKPKFMLEQSHAVEYAVRMRQFDDSQQFDRLLEQGKLGRKEIDALSETVAHFHQSIAVADADANYGRAENVIQPMLENFAQIKENLNDTAMLSRCHQLEQWTLKEIDAKRGLLDKRKQQGFVRECHGDLHLRNIAWIKSAPLAFDCIEFNDNLRWIDVCSEVAFLVMDLQDRGAAGLANRFLNRYFELSADYNSLQLLSLYLHYRAMVRAKVASLRLKQSDIDASSKLAIQNELNTYLCLAESYTRETHPCLIITHGFSASGKSTLAADVAESINAIRIRSDVERKRVMGVALQRQKNTAIGKDIYSEEVTRRTHATLEQLAENIIKAGFAVIVDATFLKIKYREQFAALAKRLTIPFYILHMDVPQAVLEQRLFTRGKDVSEANVNVLRFQLDNHDPLTDDEQKFVITYGLEKPLSGFDIANIINSG